MKPRLLISIISIVYFFTRLFHLTTLPVFADEAIYIRWGYLAFNIPKEYLLLSMLDGKPPLHNWLIGLLLPIFEDPLLAGRLVSVIAGFFTLLVFKYLFLELRLNSKTQLFGFSIMLFTPFWLFHQRMALAESLLALSFASSMLWGLKLQKVFSIKYFFGFVLSLTTALWLKTNALFFIPPLFLLPILHGENIKKSYLSRNTAILGVGVLIAFGLFCLLVITPLFPFLFNRSAEYTFKLSEMLTQTYGVTLKNNLFRSLVAMLWYATPAVVFLSLFGKKQGKVFLFMTIMTLAPFILTSKALYPRYLFPSLVPLTLAAAYGFEGLLKRNKIRLSALFWIGLIIPAVIFMLPLLFFPDKTPFLLIDRAQYLEDWSSGHGIPEVRDYLKSRLENSENKLTVATEGYFGTLPDGLTIYFQNSDFKDRIDIFGVGEPITKLTDRIENKEEAYLLVNSHRFFLSPTQENLQLILKVDRPGDSPSLLLFKFEDENKHNKSF